jgi:hypothetical protein
MPIKPSRGYTHYQNEPSNLWVINHNLNVTPAVQVYVVHGGYEHRALPKEVIVVDPNNVRIEFTEDEIGRAVII